MTETWLYQPVKSVLPGSGPVAFTVTSFGYLHPDGPELAQLTLDVRFLLRNPHVDPLMRDLTGFDLRVREHVMATPGVCAVLSGILSAALALHSLTDSRGEQTTVAIGCAGGRHRSVVLADRVGQTLADAMGRPVTVVHRDVARPVVQ